MILREKKDLRELIEKGNQYYENEIKFCVDRRRRVVCIDEEMHIVMERMLYDDGSAEEDIFGGNIIIDDPDNMGVHITWEAHCNIERNRLLGLGRGRLLTDQKTIDELFEILKQWVY